MKMSDVESVPLIHILEDDQDISDVIGYVLADAGYRTQATATFKDFARKIRKKKPALVLLDVRLPDADGRDICRKLKASNNFNDIPVIVISAHADPRTILLDSSADAFIAKPFDIDFLVDTIKKKLRSV